MANPYKKSADKEKVSPGGVRNIPIVEEPVVEKKSAPTDNPLAGMIEPKPEGKSYSFYLSVEASDNLEKLAKQNKCSKSKALDALLRSLM